MMKSSNGSQKYSFQWKLQCNSDFNSNHKKKKGEEKFFEHEFKDKLKVIAKTTLNAKLVKVIRNLQASYIEDENKILVQAEWEKATLYHLATKAM